MSSRGIGGWIWSVSFSLWTLSTVYLCDWVNTSWAVCSNQPGVVQWFHLWFESVSYLSLSGPNILFLTQTPLLCLFYLNTLSWSWCAFCGIQVIFPHISALFLSNFVATDVYALFVWTQVFFPHISALLLSNFVATDVYALSLKFWKSLPAVFFPYLA